VDRLRRLLSVVVAVVAVTAAPCRPALADGPRIVSLAPHITELLFAAGAGQLVVGASEYSDYPPAAGGVPRIGDAFRLDYERIVALRPDLAVAWQSGTPAGMVEQLRSLGLRVLVLRVGRLDEIADAIEEVGRIAGTGRQAGEAARELRRDLDGLRAAYAGRAPVRVFVELDHQPLFTVTGRHMISEMVELCGGVNVFGSLAGLAPMVDLEAVIAARPEAILYTGPAPDPQAWWRGWPEIPAVAAGAVMRVPADLVSRATPRVTAGVRAVCEAIDSVRRPPG
jgi:iron complex transport system substrate-binding protein